MYVFMDFIDAEKTCFAFCVIGNVAIISGTSLFPHIGYICLSCLLKGVCRDS